MPQTPSLLETSLVIPVTLLFTSFTLLPKPSSLPSYPHAATTSPKASAPFLRSAPIYSY
jgi:hypothetical protein